MSWSMMGVANACIMILLVIGFGWFLTWRKFCAQDKFLPQVNAYLMYGAFPCLSLVFLGIQLDLRDAAGWQAMAAYLVWILIVQACITAYVFLVPYVRTLLPASLGGRTVAAEVDPRVRLRNQLGEAGILNLLLTANNTYIIGLPVMDATFGSTGRYVALLTGIPLFLIIMPYSIVLLEVERWLGSKAAGASRLVSGAGDGAAVGVSRHVNGTGVPHPGLPGEQDELGGASGHTTPPTIRAHVPGQGSSDEESLAVSPKAQHAIRGPRKLGRRPINGGDAGNITTSTATEGGISAQGGRPPQEWTGAHPALDDTEDGGVDPREQGSQEAVQARSGGGGGHATVSITLAPAERDPGISGDQSPADVSPRAPQPSQLPHAQSFGWSKLRSPSMQRARDMLLEYVAQARRRHKLRKQARRAGVAVVDLPVPINPDVQLGRAGGPVLPGGFADDHDDYGPQGHDDDGPPPGAVWDGSTAHISRIWSRGVSSFNAAMASAYHSTRELLPTRSTAARAGVPGRSDGDAGGVGAQGAAHGQGPAGVSSSWRKGLHRITKSKPWQVTWTILKNPLLWSLLLAMLVSLSGLRVFLDPASPQYVIELGWLVAALRMLGSTAVPLALFSNGVFLYGKKVWVGNTKLAAVILLLKVTVLPALQLVCAKLLRLQPDMAMSLFLLSACPTASTSFVLATQYNRGAEVVSMVTVIATLLLVPVILAAVYIPLAIGLYDFDPSAFPLP